MNLSKNKIILLSAGGLILLVIVLIFVFKKPAGTAVAAKLTIWGVDGAGAFSGSVDTYTKAHRDSSINYVPMDPVGYEDKLIKALAAGTGPDIFYVSNHDLGKLGNLIAPLDPLQFNTANLNEQFPSVAAQDFSVGNYVYAIPLYMDNLALFYNRDIFDRAVITNPPATWDEFQAIVPKLRTLNDKGQILQAAAALGGTEKSVAHATDILNMLMLQTGTTMLSNDLTTARFYGGTQSGEGALSFYAQFADPSSKVYTWNDAQDYSLNAFATGKVAMVLGYNEDLVRIKKANPFANIAVAPAPQISASSSLAYPSYWGLAISKQSKEAAGAWDFIKFVTLDATQSGAYLNATGHPPALRSIISYNTNDPEIGVFVRQSLIARSWYVPDYDKVKEIFSTAISRVNGGASVAQALKEAQDSMNQLLRM